MSKKSILEAMRYDRKLEFVSGNFKGLTGVIIGVSYDEKYIHGVAWIVELSNGQRGYVEKSDHYRVMEEE